MAWIFLKEDLHKGIVMKFKFLASLVAVWTVAACVPEGAVDDQTVRLGPNPTLTGGTYSTGGGLTIALEHRNLGGQTGLCGVWAESEHQAAATKGGTGRIFGSAQILLDGKVVHNGLTFLPKVAPAASYSGATAECIRIGHPWSDGDERKRLTVAIPTQIVKTFSNNRKPVFTQTGPGAGTAKAPPSNADPFQVHPDEVNVARLGNDPAIYFGRYSYGGGFYIAVDLQNVGGYVGVCGAWSNDGKQSAYTPKLTSQLLQVGSVALNGRVLVNNLAYLRKMPVPDASYAGAPATCRATTIPWQDSYSSQKPDIRIPRKTFL